MADGAVKFITDSIEAFDQTAVFTTAGGTAIARAPGKQVLTGSGAHLELVR